MKSVLSTVWQLLARRRSTYALAIACLGLANGFNYLSPLAAAAAIDHALAGKAPESGPLAAIHRVLASADLEPAGHLALAAATMLGLAAIGGVFTYIRGRLVSLASDGIARDLKDRMFDHLQRLPPAFHDKSQTGDLVQRATSDVETTRQFLAVQVIDIGNAVILIALAVPLLLALDPALAAVSCSLLLPVILFSYAYFQGVRHRFKAVDEAEGAMTAKAQENLAGVRVVRAFARQQHEQERFGARNAAYRDAQLHMTRLMAWYWSVSDLVCMAQTMLTLFVGAWWVMQGDVTIGTLFAFISIINLLLWPVRQMGRILTDLGKAVVSLGRIGEVVRSPAESAPSPVLALAAGGQLVATAPDAGSHAHPATPLRGRIEARNLRFGHSPDRHALDGLSLVVEPGETVALLGPSGSGKSTLVHLLLRLYDPNSGDLRLDSHDIRSLDRAWVRGQIAAVLQEPFLYTKTVAENIRLGNPTAALDDVVQAARGAAIHETIAGFTSGYETLVGERGVLLSGGQRQRVAIARAIVRDPAVLVLDDALSAVDSETERLVLQTLERRRGRRTTLVIAHRLTTVAGADRVLVLDRGRVVQEGSPSHLRTVDGPFSRMCALQEALEKDVRQAAC